MAYELSHVRYNGHLKLTTSENFSAVEQPIQNHYYRKDNHYRPIII